MVDLEAVEALRNILAILQPLPEPSRAWVLRSLGAGASEAQKGANAPNAPGAKRRMRPVAPGANGAHAPGANEAQMEMRSTEVFSSFCSFWSLYPKKKDRLDAEKAWKKLQPNAETYELIIQALKSQSSSEQWTRDDGQYIPYARTWLNRRSWEDESEAQLAQTVAQHAAQAGRIGAHALTAKTRRNMGAMQDFLERK